MTKRCYLRIKTCTCRMKKWLKCVYSTTFTGTVQRSHAVTALGISSCSEDKYFRVEDYICFIYKYI